MSDVINRIRENNASCLASLLVIFLFVVIAVFWVGKGTYSVDVDEVLFDCVDAGVAPGDSVVCDITANFNTIKGTSVSVNYKFPEGVTFVTFDLNTDCGDVCFSENVNTEEKLVVTNEDGIKGSYLIGKVTFELPNDAKPNDEFVIGLTNVEVIDTEEQNYSYVDVTDKVRIASNVASLSNLSIDNITFDKEFNSNVFEYVGTMNSDIDKIIVNAVPTDGELATVTGAGEVALHYGTNEISVMVIAEDGNTTNVYRINIYREYNFAYSDGNYKYDEEKAILYTVNDVDKDSIIANLPKLEDGLVYVINEDLSKLTIKYGDEILESISIVNFSMSNKIVDGVVYVIDLTIKELLDTIEMNRVSVKVVNSNGEEVTTGSITNDYKLNVYYDDALLDSYLFNLEYLEIDNNIIVDNENMILNRLVHGVTYGDFKEMIKTNGVVTIIAHDDKELTDEDIIRTGDKINIDMNSNDLIYTLSVLGDINGDGYILVNDVSLLYRYVKGRLELDLVYVNAADIVNDGDIFVNDTSKLYRYFKGKITTLDGGNK